MENNIIELKPFIKMGVEKLRQELHLLIDSTNEKYLRAVHALMRTLEGEEPLLWNQLDEEQQAGLKKQLEQGEKDIRDGNVYTIEEAREMKKGW